MRELSLLIPARNEQFLLRTVEDILQNIEADTEIIVVCDGNWADPPIPDNPRITIVYHAKAHGQRQSVNEAARLSKAKYVMKADAHCAFDKGFDRKLIEAYQENTTVIPRMYNLHGFDWVCECGERVYQTAPQIHCGKPMTMEVIWKPRLHRVTDHARFDKDLKFQYWYDYDKTSNETLCFVGAAFFMSRDYYWQLDGLDEKHGSWGQMGVEVSLKTWLSGGRVVVNKDTWFSHLFRTQNGFSFPYQISFDEQEKAREYSRWLWNLYEPDKLPRWDKAIHPLKWVVDRFAPVPEWH